METVNTIVSRMRQALSLSEPDLDTTIGTPVRKILDAVAEQIAEASVDQFLLDYKYDLDAKEGDDLDDFVKLFGFTRFPAKRSVGMVLFERATPATESILIPLAAQLGTEGVSPVIVQTTTPALLAPGDISIQVPVQAVIGGASGNIPSNALRRLLTPFSGITSFTNTAALTGGADAEDDEQLRSRFKRTVFRGMAGTEHMFLGIALDDESVTHANVLGASKKYRETIELVAGVATSSLPSWNIKHIYEDSAVFGPDLDNGDILTPDVHYEFDHTVSPPTITSLDAINAPDGVYELEFEYVPWASRNDPDNGITNRIDIWVNGTRPTEASEVAFFDDTKVFNVTPGSPYDRSNFLRGDGETVPVEGNFFVPFAFAPVIDPAIDDVINIDAQDYDEDTDFWLVNDITEEGGTPVSLSGIEIRSIANGAAFEPTDADVFNVNYLFNAVPRDIELAARAWRLITTDLRVHQAIPILLNIHLAVIFNPGYPLASVQPLIEQELERHISTIGFPGVVQISDLLGVVNQVEGVDAVRFLTDADDAVNYAIQRVTQAGAVIETYSNGGTPDRATDVLVGDFQVPVFNSLVVVAKAQNSFGSV